MSDEISSSTPQKTTRKRATRKRATVKRVTRKTTARKRTADTTRESERTTRPVSSATVRKAPTAVATTRATATKHSYEARRRLMIVGLVVLVSLGTSVGVGFSDEGQIDVVSRIETRNAKVKSGDFEPTAEETNEVVTVPVKNTKPTVPNAGLRGMGSVSKPKPEPKSATSTASTTAATASSTEATTSSTTAARAADQAAKEEVETVATSTATTTTASN